MSHNSINIMAEGLTSISRVGLPLAARPAIAPPKFEPNDARIAAVGTRRPWEHDHGAFDNALHRTAPSGIVVDDAGFETAPAVVDPHWSDSVRFAGMQPHHGQRMPNWRASYEAAAKGRASAVARRTGFELPLDREIAPIHAEDSAFGTVRDVGTRGGLIDSPVAAAADATDQVRHVRMTYSDHHLRAELLAEYRDSRRPRRSDRGPVAVDAGRPARRSQSELAVDLMLSILRDLPEHTDFAPFDAVAEESKSSVERAIADLLLAATASRVRQPASFSPPVLMPQSRGIALTA